MVWFRAYHFANADPFRAATHNKGIMNGISAVALALGQDTRAIEAGAHAYASLSGQYKSLTTWEKNQDGGPCGDHRNADGCWSCRRCSHCASCRQD